MALTGIIFPKSGEFDGLDTYYKWTGTGMMPPYPATYLWKFCPITIGQMGYYGCPFWWASDEGGFTASGYYGGLPYPDNSTQGVIWNWELAHNGADLITDAVTGLTSTTLVGPGFLSQALVVRVPSGTDLEMKFYYDLPNTNRYIINTVSGYASTFPASPYSGKCMSVGQSPWTLAVNGTTERMCGILRGQQAYTTNLSESNILSASACETDAEVLALAYSNLWYLNMNPSPSDITDKSGGSHNPSWADSNNRGTLWTKPDIIMKGRGRFPKYPLRRFV